MQANTRSGTKPELRLRSVLHGHGKRFRKDFLIREGDLRVHVDIAFPGAKVAVFVDGCFWHSCPAHGSQPKRNAKFWRTKLERNAARDREVNRGLRAAGWDVVRIWEHESVEEGVERIESALEAVQGVRYR